MGAELYRANTTTVDILAKPQNPATISKYDSQLLFGESFKAEHIVGEWIYGTSEIDGYRGHVRLSQMIQSELQTTHVVSATLTHIYPEPDFKTRPLMILTFLSQLCIKDFKALHGFYPLAQGGWVFKDHIRPVEGYYEADILKTAMQFLHAPYLYGGRSPLGIDCSGLVQLAILNSGRACLRDTDQQVMLGHEISRNAIESGDLVFFKGHTGIMVDEYHILNATARTMDVRIEKLDTLTQIYDGITGIRRL